MTRSPVDHAAPTSSDEEVGSAAQTPGSAAGESDVASVEATATATAAADADADDDGDEDEVLPFGEQPATRFAADVEYRGRADGHHYVVRVRHRLLDSTFTVAIDGIEHDPKAEEKARKARTAKGKDESEDDAEPSEQGEDADPSDREPDPSDEPAPDGPSDDSVLDDGLRFRLEDGFSTLHCTVRRRSEEGELEDAEVITIRTAGLGGAGEVEVRHGLRTTPLVPADGSPSAARDEKRTAHPTRYALIAALTKAATFLLPLLGIGALFSGLLDPVKEWIAERIRPVIEAIGQVIRPIGEWLEAVTRPVREFIDSLFAPIRDFFAMLLTPVRELIAAILRPIGEALRWLLGLLPDIGLNLDVPGWLVDVLVPVVVVVAVFVATFSRLRHRRDKLAETAKGADETAKGAEAGPSRGTSAGTSRGADPESSRDANTEGGDCTEGRDYDAESPESSSRDARNEARSAGESSTQN